MFSFHQKIILLIGAVSVLSMLYFLSQSLYQDYKIQKQIQLYSEKNRQISEDIEYMKENIDYYSTDNYRDKYAKEVLNKLNPGEKVIVLSPQSENVLIPESSFLQTPQKKSMKDTWYEFFFGKQRVEDRVAE